MITPSDMFGIACLVVATGGVAYFITAGPPMQERPRPQIVQVPPAVERKFGAQPAKLAGTYYAGAGRGSICLTLKPNGTYAAEWHGCMTYGEASGTWRIAGSTIMLSPLKEWGMLKEYLETLDIVDLGDQIVLVRPEWRIGFEESVRAHPRFVGDCFQRQDKFGRQKSS
jgi:hypothetical protein